MDRDEIQNIVDNMYHDVNPHELIINLKGVGYESNVKPGYGLAPPCNKPLPQSFLAHIYVAIWHQ